MQIVFEDHTGSRELDVVLHDPDAVVDDLVDALAGEAVPGHRLVVDGCVLPAGRRLDRAGITDGAVVRLSRSSAAGSSGSCDHVALAPKDPGIIGAVAVIDVIGGLDAGRSRTVAAGSWSVGRVGADVIVDDPTVSADHARIDLEHQGAATITDQGSLNGSWVDESATVGPTAIGSGSILRVGASQLELTSPGNGDRPVASGPERRFSTRTTVPFNRPPRPTARDEHEPIDPPRAPVDAAGTSAVGVVAVIAPLVLGLVMVKVFHNWLYGMFALLSPVMLIGNAFESRRRRHKTRRKDRARYEADLVAFAARLAGLAAVERERRLERLPAPPEIVRRATGPSARLWERRPGHDDFGNLRAGLGSVSWDPPVDGRRRAWDAEVRAAVDAVSTIDATPVDVTLGDGDVIGIFGLRRPTLALARSLLAQAATLHGPADLPVAVLTASGREEDWDWAKWLPHTLGPSGAGQRLLAADPEAADRLLRTLLEQAPKDQPGASAFERRHAEGPVLVVVVDDETLTEGRRSPARSVLRGVAGPAAGIVIAEAEDRLPAACNTVIEMIGEHGRAAVHRPASGQRDDEVLVCGIGEPTARRLARALARFEDPELEAAGASLPATVDLLPLLGLDPPWPQAVLRQWRSAGPDPDLVAPIGVAEDGVLAIDLVRDGPHGLVAGTTGAGKSELLRSLVAGLAVACPPDHLTFVLIDFKGGSAFDECARLPHTVGMVTDLDEHLGARALRCLEAELRHRERRLRAAGVDSLGAYRQLRLPCEPMPRLVVVIDEFATLKNELPEFVDALVGVAQRGRSLGVHLVLATQRPSGAVSENIRANTNLRIALRVQDASDSQDVIDLPDAASIARNVPGRALVRLGPGEVVSLQSALSTGVAIEGGHRPVEVRPFPFAAPRQLLDHPPGAATDADPGSTGAPSGRTLEQPPTDLARLVDAVQEAFSATAMESPRRPWPEPLPARIDLDDLIGVAPDDEPGTRFGEPGGVVRFALADLPDEQDQRPTGWIPAEGNLLLVGIGGSGTTTALAAIALSAACGASPDDLHLYVLDFGAGELDPLRRLPHTGAVIAADEHERQGRLLRHLRQEISRRRTLSDPRGTEARLLVLVDGMGGFRAAWDEADPSGTYDELMRVFADGPELGVHMVVSADRPGAVPVALSGLARQRLIFRLGDDLDYGIYGISTRDVPRLSPGGAVLAETGTEVRVGRPSPDLDAATARAATTGAARSRANPRPPAAVRALPTSVGLDEILPAARFAEHPWVLPLGIGDAALEPVGVTLYEGEHALIVGPSRSGRTTALCAAAHVVRASGARVTTVAVASARSALARAPGLGGVLAPDAAPAAVEAVGAVDGPVLVLVDDADLVDDSDGSWQALLDLRRDDLHVVAAGRAEALRQLFGHWTRTIRASRTGLLLQPDPDLDGEVLGVRLPRHAPVALGPGRGYLVTGGRFEVVQLMEEHGLT